MKILLIGASGQLGSDLLRNNTSYEIVAPGREELDLARAGEFAAVIGRHQPDAIVNCGAFHNVPLCEERPEEAFRINCVAVRELASVAAGTGAWFLTFSSDYVFGGDDKRTPYREDDRPAPVQMYGITRLAGECAALAMAPGRAVVIRTCGLYGRSGARSKGGNFVDGRVEDGIAGRQIEMACEQIVAPTSTDDLSRAVLQLLGHADLKGGIYHLVNDGACSWYDLTQATVEILRLPSEVVPVDRGGRSGRMRRPLYSVLGNTKARKLGITLRPWREALDDYLKKKYPDLYKKAKQLGAG